MTTFTNLGRLMTSLTWQEIDNLKLEHILIWIHTTFLHFIYMLSRLHRFTYISMGSFYSEIYREKGQAPNQEWRDFNNKFWEIGSHLAHCKDYVTIILILFCTHQFFTFWVNRLNFVESFIASHTRVTIKYNRRQKHGWKWLHNSIYVYIWLW